MIELTGKRALVVGVANDQSIAWGVAQALRQAGAELAITYLNAKAEAYVRPLAESVNEYWRREGRAFGDGPTVAKAAE